MSRHDLTDTFTRLRQRLRIMATFILKDEDNADDALQEAFCRMWAKKDLREDFPKEKQVITVVRNVCIDFLRRKKSRQTYSIEQHTSWELNKNQATIESNSIWEETEVRMLTCQLMSKLNDNQRKVFEMVSKGMDYDIIAMRLGKTEAWVRQNICRARKLLVNEYKKLY